MRPAPSVGALRDQARRRLPRPLFDFIDGGAEDEATLRANEASFDDWAILPRPLEGAATRDLSVTLFGQRLSSPVLVGPTGLAGLFWPHGEIATAQAAAEHGTVYCLSHGSVCTLEELAQAHHGQRWMQVFIYKDRAFTRELVDRARAAGYQGLVVTVDNQLLGKRERDLANGFSIPPRFGPRQWGQFAGKLPWWWAMRRHLPRLTFGNYVREGSRESVAGLAGRMASMLDPGMGWDDIAEVRRRWDGPLLIKGLLHPQDALQALRVGVDGIIVSNHGGRQLDGALSSLRALPGVLRAVDGRMPVLLDGGVRRGSDVFKALALGASAVLVGRPHLWGLAVAGAQGVSQVLQTLDSELDRAMGLAGVRQASALSSMALLVPNVATHLTAALSDHTPTPTTMSRMPDTPSPRLPPEIEGPSVWYGPEMARRTDWVEPLSAPEVAEIAAAAAGWAGQDLAPMQAADFALPQLGPRLRRIREEVLRGRGFALLRGLPVADWPEPLSEAAFYGIGTHFGAARTQNAQGHLLGHVRDMGLRSDDPAVRIYQTAERQTFHTDSCDIVGLLCLQVAREGGHSALVSSNTMWNEMRRRRPDLAALLLQPVATDRRGEVAPGESPFFTIPVFNWHEEQMSAIYQRQYIDSAQRFPEAPRLDAAWREALDLFDALANDPALNFLMTLQRGDIQLVHNHTLLHDRTAFQDAPEPALRRHLLRLWLAPDDARALPAVFAQRYGSVVPGRRGGVGGVGGASVSA